MTKYSGGLVRVIQTRSHDRQWTSCSHSIISQRLGRSSPWFQPTLEPPSEALFWVRHPKELMGNFSSVSSVAITMASLKSTSSHSDELRSMTSTARSASSIEFLLQNGRIAQETLTKRKSWRRPSEEGPATETEYHPDPSVRLSFSLSHLILTLPYRRKITRAPQQQWVDANSAPMYEIRQREWEGLWSRSPQKQAGCRWGNSGEQKAESGRKSSHSPTQQSVQLVDSRGTDRSADSRGAATLTIIHDSHLRNLADRIIALDHVCSDGTSIPLGKKVVLWCTADETHRASSSMNSILPLIIDQSA